MGRLLLLSGPSCIGKGPLCAALARFYPQLTATMGQLTLYNDRAPRPGEQEGGQYLFRSRAEIETMGRQPGFVLIRARADLQALDLGAIQRTLDAGLDVFYEGNPYVPARLREEGILARLPSLTMFLAPLCREEILSLRHETDLAALVTELQRHKLLHRTTKQKGTLGAKDLEDVETRAGLAYQELKEAWTYDHVIPLYDGEGHDHWDAFPQPVGSARRAFLAVAALLQGQEPPPGSTERWEEGLIP